jgi:hypothetical protein
MSSNPKGRAVAEKSSAPAKTEATEPAGDVSAVAAQILDGVGGDATKAAQALEDRILKDRDLFRVTMTPLVGRVCAEIVGKVIRDRRASISNAVKQADDAIAGAAALQATAQSMLDFPLPGGKLLRHATSDDCVDAARAYEKQAQDMAGKSRFLRNVGLRAGANLVGEVLTEMDLVQLFKRAMQS